MNNNIKRLIAIIAGATLPLAFAPLNLCPFAFIAPAVLFWLWLDSTPRMAWQTGLLFGYGYFGVGVSWVYVAIHDIGQSPFLLSIVLTFLFVSILAVFPGFVGWLAVKLKGTLSETSWLLAILPACWVLFEWLRGWVFTGFTWIQLGYSQTDLWLSGYASWLGVYGVSWAVALTSALLLLAVLRSDKTRWISVTGIALVWGTAFAAAMMNWSEPAGKPIKVTLIQGNAPQITKWDEDKIMMRLNLYADLTRENWDSDLIIWPENAMTTFYHTLESSYLNPLAEEAIKNNTDLLFGAPVMDLDSEQYYSSFVSMGETPGMYHKFHLVPFGEFIPLESLLRGMISFFDLPMSGFTPGKKDQSPLMVAGQVIAPTVCFEDAFGEEVIRHLPEATVIVNGSNNAWYGDSFAPHQHLQISRMRAIETARPLLRVTTNGISAFIDYKGKVQSRSKQFETDVITGMVQPRQGETLYVKVGNTAVIIIVIIILVLFGLLGRKVRTMDNT